MLSEVDGGRFHQLAALASGLSEVELRVLLDLAARADPPHFTCRVSTRALATSTGCSRRNVQKAIATLASRAMVTHRPGTATQPAAFG